MFTIRTNLLLKPSKSSRSHKMRSLKLHGTSLMMGAIFLAAKFLKVKLPSDGEKVWWQEFDVTPRQLEEVSNQMLELYEQNKLPQGSEIEGSSVAVHSQHGPSKASAINDEWLPSTGPIPAGAGSVSSLGKLGASKNTSSRSGADHAENYNAPLKTGHSNDDGSTDMSSVITERKVDIETKDNHLAEFSKKDGAREAPNRTETQDEQALDNEKVDGGRRNETTDTDELREIGSIRKHVTGRNVESSEHPVSQSPQDALKKLYTGKFKAQFEKRKKSRPDIIQKTDVVDEDDLIERALEDGVELAVEDERMKRERGLGWSANETLHHSKDHNTPSMSGQSCRATQIAEEGEMLENSSPGVNGRKRKGSPLDKRAESQHRHEYVRGHNQRIKVDALDNGHRAGKGGGYTEREFGKHT
uniref:Uncharacterized protein n=1 Tax=Kalanchoe fedtschenkoi TaxID=63787 RepID=A0A7N0ZQT1_KALFE